MMGEAMCTPLFHNQFRVPSYEDWVDGEAYADDRNPARPAEVVARVPVGDRATADAALAAARGALRDWARLPAPARGEILFRAAALLMDRSSDIGTELSREEGKTLVEGVGEVRRAASIIRYFAGQTTEAIGSVYASATPGTRIHTIRQPVGVVAAITPWNFPIAIPAWKVAPALAFGNTVVLKPASATPLTAHRLVEAFVDAGLPAGVLNLVYASGEVVASSWFVPGGADAISFTGSETVGRGIQAAAGATHAKVQLELGGKNAVVVAEDADVDKAAQLIVRGAMASAGQKCTATSRVIAIGGVLPALRDAITARVEALVPGDPLDPDTTLGPVIDMGAKERIAAAVAEAQRSGARILTRRPVPSAGAFAPAVVFDRVVPDMTIAREEIFGPVVAVIEAADLGEALRVHDMVAYGLSASIFTRDLGIADTFVHAARAGIVHVNGETAGAEPHVPFGGMKASSSWSREQGHEAEAFYTQTKTIYVDGLPGAGLFDVS
jgi:aldehyde dehydrogenase (NAD+)